jgi:hypothetical protein
MMGDFRKNFRSRLLIITSNFCASEVFTLLRLTESRSGTRVCGRSGVPNRVAWQLRKLSLSIVFEKHENQSQNVLKRKNLCGTPGAVLLTVLIVPSPMTLGNGCQFGCARSSE